MQGASALTNKIVIWMGQNRQAAAQYDSELKQIISDLQNCNNKADFSKLQRQFSNIALQVKSSGSLYTGFFNGLKSGIKDAFENILRYQLAYKVIDQVISGFKSMVNAVADLDKKLTEFNKVADLTSDKLLEFSDRAFDAADEVGRTGSDMIEAATEFKRAGYSLEDSLDMGKSALLMTNVADGITQTSDAASTLIAVLKGFNINESDIMTIVDKMNSVSNQSPVGFDNLADGLERVSGTMNQAGNSIDETIGLLTGGYAQLRNMEKVSTGLITISQRLRAIDEDGDEIDGLSAELSESFGKIGVAIEDSNGDLRSTYDILSDYAKIYPQLTSEQKQYYAELASGKRQVNVFNAIVQQIADVDKAIEQSKDSLGSAANENEIYRQSVEGLRNELKNEFQSVSKKVINSDWIKDVLSGATDLLKVFENIIEQDTIVGSSIGVLAEGFKDLSKSLKDITGNDGVAKLIKLFITYKTITKGVDIFNLVKGKKDNFVTTSNLMKTFFESAVSGSLKVEDGFLKVGEAADVLSDGVSNVAAKEGSAIDTTKKLTTSITGLGTSLKNLALAHPYLLAITAALGTMYGAYKLVNAVQDWADGTTAVNKYNKSIEKSEENVSKNSDSISEYSSTIEENKQKIEELHKLQEDGTITEAQKAEIENLKYQNALLDEKIEKLKEANNEEVKTQARDSEKAFNKQFGNGFDVGSNASDVISSVSKNFNGDGTANGVSWNMATSGNDKDTAVAQLAKIKLATDAYNDAVKELNNATDEDQKNIVSDTTTTWLKRNNALSDSMSTLSSEINAQKQAYEYYMNAFNSYGLDEYYKNQIADGSISIDVIYDDDLKDAISDCQDFYDKAQDAKTAVQELNIELKGLAKSRFDNIKSQYEEQINQVDEYNNLLQKELDIIETKGWISSTFLNESMKEQDMANLERLKDERTALTNALDSGKIEKYSEQWYDMQSSINSVSSAIYDAEKAIISYDKAIRQVNWDAFDKTRDDVENLIGETDFLIELLKDNGITDDNGNMNDNGNAVQALLAQKYELYLNQAKAYKDEILKIDEELANDPYDKELLDRKQELIKAQQDAIKNSKEEKSAIKDLMSNAYDKLKDSISNIITKIKDGLSATKDLLDYERNVKKQADNISSLQKQLLSLQGDNSESAQSKRQSINTQLQDAKDELQQTEMEKAMSDVEQILDNVQSELETWISKRLDNIDELIGQVIESSNTNAGSISDTITSTAESNGYKLSESMASIWSTNTGNITNVLGDFSNKFVEGNNAITNVCNNINSAVQGLLANSNAEAQRVADEIARQQAEQNASSDGGYSGGSDYSSDDWSSNWDTDSDDSGSSYSGDVDWIYEENYFPRDLLNIDQSVIDRLKYNNFDSSFGARSQYYEQMGGDGQYTGSYDQNVWMLDYLKSHGLKNGTKSATAGLHRTDEEGLGSEVIFSKKYGTLRRLDAGDMVFNKDQVEKLWNLSKGITTPNMYMDNLGAKLPDITPVSTNKSVDIGGINVNVDKVVTDNPEDFTRQLGNALASNSRVQKIINENVSNAMLGRNSLSTRKYVR